MKSNKHSNSKDFVSPEIVDLGSAIDMIKNEFRPGVNDSFPSVQNINTDG